MKDAHHPLIHVHRGSISGGLGSGLEAAEKLDPPSDATADNLGKSQQEAFADRSSPNCLDRKGSAAEEDVDPKLVQAIKRVKTEPVSQAVAEDQDHLDTFKRTSNSDDELSLVKRITTSKNVAQPSSKLQQLSYLTLLDPGVDNNATKSANSSDHA